jgi:hypothetical protein
MMEELYGLPRLTELVELVLPIRQSDYKSPKTHGILTGLERPKKTASIQLPRHPPY